LGPERVKQTIHEALAKGADRGIHIADDHFAQLDPLGAAKMLVGEGDIHDCFGKLNDAGKPALRRLGILSQQLRTSPLLVPT
jgi:hypothetical protein